MEEELPETEEEWREKLSEEEYRILREQGTEPAGSGDLVHVDEDGIFRCAGCGQELFSSADKFESGTGWPSFSDLLDEGNVELDEDTSHGMTRTEVVCSRCGGHLGHLFDDSMESDDSTRSTGTNGSGSDPKPTGKRYCINSTALDFDPDDEEA